MKTVQINILQTYFFCLKYINIINAAHNGELILEVFIHISVSTF